MARAEGLAGLFAAAAAGGVLLAGCASLPEVHPWSEAAGDKPPPTLVGSRGRTISPERTAAILSKLGKGSDAFARLAAIEEEVSGKPLALGNAATLLYDGPRSYRAMFDEIERARDHINAEFYIIEDDEVGRQFADALIRKAQQGLSVNLMYDSVGSNATEPAYFERLRAGGVKVVEFNPVNPLRARGAWRVNNRDHRKIVIVDGRVAFTGGINISDVYSSGSSPGTRRRPSGGGSPHIGSGPPGSKPTREIGWRDTNVRIEGPVVAQVQHLFLDAWEKQGGEPLAPREWFPQVPRAGDHPARFIASGPDDPVPAIYVSLHSAIEYAQRTVHITMAYFVPDPQTLEALEAATARGVEVTLVVPSYTDFWAVFHAGRAHYAELLAAGVKIYERQQALLHAKTAVIDGVWSTVGSSNMDWRSYLHNEEVNLVVLGADFGKQMETMFTRDVAESARIEPEAWEKRPLSVRMKEWAAQMAAYWL